MAELPIQLPEITAPIPKLEPPPVPVISLQPLDFTTMQKAFEDMQLQQAIAENLEINDGIELSAKYEEPDIKPYVDAFNAWKGANPIQSCIQMFAHTMTAQSLCLVPCMPGEKRPIGTWKSIKATPAIASFQSNGFGFLTESSNLIIIDVDVQNNGLHYWNNIVQILGLSDMLRNVPCEMTTTGGYHYYFKGKAPQSNGTIIYVENGKTVKVSIDVKSETSFCRCAPSEHIVELGKDGLPKKAKVIDNITWIRPIYDPRYPLIECPQSFLSLMQRTTSIKQTGNRAKIVTEHVQKSQLSPKQALSVECEGGFILDVGGEISDAKDPGTNITYEMGEEICMQGLTDECITGHDAGLKIIRAYAHWAVAGGFEEKGYELMETFNKLRRPASDMNKAGRLGYEWNKAKDVVPGKSVITMRSVVAMLKECNPEMFDRMFRAAKPLPEAKCNTFDKLDNYYFKDFETLCENQVFESRSDLIAFLKVELPRVLALMKVGKGFFVKKDSPDDLFSIITYDDMGGANNFPIEYWSDQIPDKAPEWTIREVPCVDDPTKKKKQHRKSVKFFDFFKENKKHFPSFTKPDVFANGVVPPGMFNMWTGFKAQRVPVVDHALLKPLLDVLRFGWASGKENVYKRIITFLAKTVVEPDIKIGNALVLYGLGGEGKSTIVDFLIGKVLGPQLCTNEPDLQSLFCKQFNAKLRGKKLHTVNECEQDDKTARSKILLNSLKNMITSPTLTVSEKYQNERECRDISNFILCTNHKDAIPIEPPRPDEKETAMERRLTFIQVSRFNFGEVEEQKIKQKWAWFAEVYLKDQNVADHFLTYLLDLPRSEWDQNMNASLRTELTVEIAEMAKEGWQDFIDELFINPDPLAPDYGAVEFGAKALYDRYLAWSKGQKVIGSKTFYNKIAKIADGKRILKGYAYYKFANYKAKLLARPDTN